MTAGQGPIDLAATLQNLAASEPAYYARVDQLEAGYQQAATDGREPTDQEKAAHRRHFQDQHFRALHTHRRMFFAGGRIMRAEHERWLNEQ